MATDKSKVGSSILLRADGTEMSASPGAESCMQDEDGYVFLRLAIFVERDIISQCGFYTAPEIPDSLKSALSELKLSDSELKSPLTLPRLCCTNV